MTADIQRERLQRAAHAVETATLLIQMEEAAVAGWPSPHGRPPSGPMATLCSGGRANARADILAP